jgi:hypothetical protein
MRSFSSQGKREVFSGIIDYFRGTVLVFRQTETGGEETLYVTKMPDEIVFWDGIGSDVLAFRL